MSIADTAAEPEAGTSSDIGSDTVGAADVSLQALAVAADPALSGLQGAYHANHTFDVGSLASDAHAYDAHVALVLDPGLLPEIDSMLDHLTSSPDLFDVPAMDFGGAADDATST